MGKEDNVFMKNKEGKKLRTEKTIKQKIASAQMRLNRLKSKEKSLTKSAETRLKIILGAEVAKAMGCKIEEVDKEFVLGMLLQASNINTDAKARIKLRGKRFLEDMVGRQE
ncbi:conjugal transfer TraD family protein [Klebsiella oxytoca]|nr:conjugal transfer TraD family protein [Klebsiella oxytoca]